MKHIFATFICVIVLHSPTSMGDRTANASGASASSSNSGAASLDKCEAFFIANPDARQFARKREPGALDIISEIIKDKVHINDLHCAIGSLRSMKDQAVDVWTLAKTNYNLKTRLMRECDEDISGECKLKLAALAPVAYGSMDSEQIKKISTQELRRTADRYQDLNKEITGRQETHEILALKNKDPDRLTDTEKSKLQSFNQDALKRNAELKKKTSASLAAVKAAMETAGVKLDCYNPQKARELLCYGIAYVVDPISLAVPVVKGLSALRAAAKLRALNAVEYAGQSLITTAKVGDGLLVPRSAGGYSPGKILNIDGNKALVEVTAKDSAGNSVAGRKLVDLKDLKDVGSEVTIPRSDGTFSQGQITGRYSDGNVRVDFVDTNGEAKYKVVDPSKLRPTSESASVAKQDGTYTFNSLKVADYKTSNGQKVIVNFDSPYLQSTMRETMDTFQRSGASKVASNATPSTASMDRAAKAWLEQAKRFEHKPSSHDSYGAERDRIIRAGGGSGDLGQIASCEAAVCRELSVFGSVAFAELGYTTRVVRGTIPSINGKPGGGHAWIEILDPRSGRAIGLVDSNYTRRFYSDPSAYYRETGAMPSTYYTIAEP